MHAALGAPIKTLNIGVTSEWVVDCNIKFLDEIKGLHIIYKVNNEWCEYAASYRHPKGLLFVRICSVVRIALRNLS